MEFDHESLAVSMPSPTSPHLVAVWNPSYTSTPMEAHLAVLQDHLRAWRDGRIVEDDAYVWWGKIRSENRQQGVPDAKITALQALDAELEADPERELQLYLTDYRSLYVGQVDEVSWEDESAEDPGHVPGYYQKDGRLCDCWFRLRDLRRLVSDDTLAVIAELKLLRNTGYHDRPVSLYGGMVDLPLLVTRPDGKLFFDAAARAPLAAGQRWVEFDAEQAGAGAMQKELRENLFGDAAWAALDPVTRTFVATAEKVFRDHRNDESFDFQAVLGPLAKAVEAEVNARLRAALRKAPDEARLANLGDRTVDLREHPALSLGQLARAMGGEAKLNRFLAGTFTDPWFANQLPAILDALAEARNPGAHNARVSRDVARQWRDRLLGVGCQGLLVELTRVRLKG